MAFKHKNNNFEQVKKTFIGLCTLFFCVSLSFNVNSVEQASEFSTQQPVNYLVYGTAGEPLQIVDDSGKVGGFITDIVNEIFVQSNILVVPNVRPITRQKPAMINGDATRWIAYALNSWKKESVWGDATFADVDLLPYTLSLGYKNMDDTVEMTSLSPEIANSGVVWIRGFKYPGTAEFSQRYGFEFERAKNHNAMLRMVDAGHARFFMEHAPRMRYIMKKQGMQADDFLFYSLEEEVPSTAITLLMSNDLGDDTIAFVNRRLKEMFASGRIAELTEAYDL